MAKTTEKPPAWTAVLAAMCPLFRGISAADVEVLLDQLNGRRKQIAKGESFMRVGDRADKFAVVLSGSLVIVAYGPDGRRNIVKHVDAMRPVERRRSLPNARCASASRQTKRRPYSCLESTV